ncbi:RNA-directed DNA polymerase protein [Dioscorea alata]|uniref:RNA-directed DNA polymerase protein n=1 Tax=Dioscorea alata TaxID=55571 RepID=A0ACB7UZ52_DIOAL|nr:RNA-directed DNA polymerase protein [Dioscorea alata]
MKQKARCQWVKLGDQNTKYFYRLVHQRRTRNKISQLVLPNGEVCTDPSIISKEILDHYMNLLGRINPRSEFVHRTIFQDNCVSEEDCGLLCREISEQEILNTLKGIKGDKSPGPDGFNSTFFKKTWKIVGSDIIRAVKDYFGNGIMLRQANATTITLIPKVAEPKSLTDYRPIS